MHAWLIVVPRLSRRGRADSRGSLRSRFAPTIYFPLIVHEAMMIEPTETESRETLDEFVEAMKGIAEQVRTDPASIHAAPVTTPVGRPDEVTAARKPVVQYEKPVEE